LKKESGAAERRDMWKMDTKIYKTNCRALARG
jgi:hypothetical protein